jgi:hypothetical protein
MTNDKWVPEWVPVEKDLPEDDTWVLVQVEESKYTHYRAPRLGRYSRLWKDWYILGFGWIGFGNYPGDVTAWIPLPPPYNRES